MLQQWHDFILFVAEQYSIIYLYNIFLHSSVDGHLGCFYLLCIANSASVNTEVLYTHSLKSFRLTYLYPNHGEKK